MLILACTALLMAFWDFLRTICLVLDFLFKGHRHGGERDR